MELNIGDRVMNGKRIRLSQKITKSSWKKKETIFKCFNLINNRVKYQKELNKNKRKSQKDKVKSKIIKKH